MSELAKTIDRLEQWADYWEPHQPAEFIADLRVLINAAKAVSRAVDWLQRAQRYDVDPTGDYYQGEGMVHSSSGDYVEFSDIGAAIDILQEGQQ